MFAVRAECRAQLDIVIHRKKKLAPIKIDPARKSRIFSILFDLTKNFYMHALERRQTPTVTVRPSA